MGLGAYQCEIPRGPLAGISWIKARAIWTPGRFSHNLSREVISDINNRKIITFMEELGIFHCQTDEHVNKSLISKMLFLIIFPTDIFKNLSGSPMHWFITLGETRLTFTFWKKEVMSQKRLDDFGRHIPTLHYNYYNTLCCSTVYLMLIICKCLVCHDVVKYNACAHRPPVVTSSHSSKVTSLI